MHTNTVFAMLVSNQEFYALVLSVDVLQSGAWTLMKDLEDPELCQLAAALPSTILQCRAESTTKKYLGAFHRWKLWADTQGVQVFPAQEHYVALYLQYLKETRESKATAEEAINALSWVHRMAGIPSPAAGPLCRQHWKESEGHLLGQFRKRIQ